MVHLATIPNDDVAIPEMRRMSIAQETLPENVSTSVYGSRFALAALPSHEMPEEEMPKDVAYRLIK